MAADLLDDFEQRIGEIGIGFRTGVSFWHMQQAITRNIAVSVETRFLEGDSDPDEQYFVWAYRITIENHGDETVQLLTRHWQITDSQGRLKEVRGDGVVGEQPVLEPGGHFTYSSGTPFINRLRLYARQLWHADPSR